jgi:hypothetical protein
MKKLILILLTLSLIFSPMLHAVYTPTIGRRISNADLSALAGL